MGATTGVVGAPKGYFKAMKSVCDKYGALFILDEVSLLVFIVSVEVLRQRVVIGDEWNGRKFSP